MVKKQKVKPKEKAEPIQVFPHGFRCKGCGLEFENSVTNSPDCPKCNGQVDRIR